MTLTLTEPERAQRVEVSDLQVKTLGVCQQESPLTARLGSAIMHRVGEADRVLLEDQQAKLALGPAHPWELPSFELAGQRNKIFFDPAKLRCGIVTCGGLCPGINNVIRGLVLELTHAYGVQTIFGFRYGFEGLVDKLGHEPLVLRPEMVASIHQQGGTMLGTSRGGQDPGQMVDRLEALGISALFVIGGDGTLRGATKIVEEVERRHLVISVVGI